MYFGVTVNETTCAVLLVLHTEMELSIVEIFLLV